MAQVIFEQIKLSCTDTETPAKDCSPGSPWTNIAQNAGYPLPLSDQRVYFYIFDYFYIKEFSSVSAHRGRLFPFLAGLLESWGRQPWAGLPCTVPHCLPVGHWGTGRNGKPPQLLLLSLTLIHDIQARGNIFIDKHVVDYPSFGSDNFFVAGKLQQSLCCAL